MSPLFQPFVERKILGKSYGEGNMPEVLVTNIRSVCYCAEEEGEVWGERRTAVT